MPLIAKQFLYNFNHCLILNIRIGISISDRVRSKDTVFYLYMDRKFRDAATLLQFAFTRTN